MANKFAFYSYDVRNFTSASTVVMNSLALAPSPPAIDISTWCAVTPDYTLNSVQSVSSFTRLYTDLSSQSLDSFVVSPSCGSTTRPIAYTATQDDGITPLPSFIQFSDSPNFGLTFSGTLTKGTYRIKILGAIS